MPFRYLNVLSHIRFVTLCFLSIALITFSAKEVHAMDLAVSKAQLTGTNVAAKTTRVRFNINWNNAWRYGSGPNNWDAAWVFVKYQIKATGQWQHAKLALTGHSTVQGITFTPGTTPSNGSTGTAPTTADGVFIHFTTNGTGPISVKTAETHRTNVMRKLNLHSTADIVRYAVRNHLVQP